MKVLCTSLTHGALLKCVKKNPALNAGKEGAELIIIQELTFAT